MDNFLEILISFGSFIPAFIVDIIKDIVVGIISFGISSLTIYLFNFRKMLETDYLLKMNKSDTYLSLPIRNGQIDTQRKSILTWNYITFDEALVINEIQKIIDKEKRTKLILQDPAIEVNFYNRNSQDNLICIGGPMANDEVAKYFGTDKPLSKVKFRWDNINDKKKMNEFAEFIYPANEKTDLNFGEIIFGENKKFNYRLKDEGYIMLVRLVGKRDNKHNDFSDPEHGTVHILFGVNAKCTLAATKIFNHQSKALKNIVKKHKGHYLIVIKCKLQENSVEVDFNQVFDYTHEIFDD